MYDMDKHQIRRIGQRRRILDNQRERGNLWEVKIGIRSENVRCFMLRSSDGGRRNGPALTMTLTLTSNFKADTGGSRNPPCDNSRLTNPHVVKFIIYIPFSFFIFSLLIIIIADHFLAYFQRFSHQYHRHAGLY